MSRTRSTCAFECNVACNVEYPIAAESWRCTSTSLGSRCSSQQSSTRCPIPRLTGIPPDWACEVRVYWTCQAIVAEGITGYASGTEVLRGQHTPRCHDSHQSIKSGFLGVLEQQVRKCHAVSSSMRLTVHLSNESARAPELDTSSVRPLRFCRMSCSFSKLERGGGKCRLREMNIKAPS